MTILSTLLRRALPLAAISLLVAAMGGTWLTARPALAAPATQPSIVAAAGEAPPAKKSNRKDLAGKLNLNTATEEQLLMLPTVGPSKAERIVAWRKKNGGFKRVADLRRVKGFGYRTFKHLEPFLDIKGDTTLTQGSPRAP